ncbi:hypothetical protein F2Q69_00047506 [Brassica cretica]|uniref:Uncharacterized protein n=1 Tax=Brassica cretica TaxID=69181 RepID=A0A8S9PRI2_BRACR|nr:hypothetical protein F2Q69_00047506 [Brassica cretica]
MQRDTVLRRMEDEIEYMRIGCDKLAISDKATADRLGSLENQIAKMGLESNNRLGALANQMLALRCNRKPKRLNAKSIWRKSHDTTRNMSIGSSSQ